MFNITFLQTFAESAEAYFDPVKHLICSFFAKILKAVAYFHKSSILHVWQSSKYIFARLCTGCSMKRTSHCSCYRVFKQQLLSKSINDKLVVISTMKTFPKNQIFLNLFSDRRLWVCCSTKGAAYCSVRRAL